MILGCIADDFTGATDLANNLVRAGMRVVQTIGVPTTPAAEAGLDEVDAVVVALKSRTAPVDEAVAQSLAACHWLRAGGAQQIYFKVCSTFDSTPRGNIGPVAQALMAHLGAEAAAASTSAGLSSLFRQTAEISPFIESPEYFNSPAAPSWSLLMSPPTTPLPYLYVRLLICLIHFKMFFKLIVMLAMLLKN
jgi:hypothetical protein